MHLAVLFNDLDEGWKAGSSVGPKHWIPISPPTPPTHIMHRWAPPEYATFPQQLELLSSPGQNCHTTAQWPQQGHYVMIRPHLSYCAATQGGANHQCWSLQSLSSKEPNHKLGDSVFLDRGGSEWYMKSLLSRKSLSQFVPGMFALTSWISLSVFCILPGREPRLDESLHWFCTGRYRLSRCR